MDRHLARSTVKLALLLACVFVLFLTGCCDDAGQREIASHPTKPAAPDLSSPTSSVRSYLEWTTYAQRLANSEVASDAMEPFWGVHVDSYIERLRQEENKGIDQTLVKLDVRSSSTEGTSAVVTASEDWKYRYFSLADQTYLTPEYSISYDTTYALVLMDGKWFVSDVQAAPRGELK